MWKRQGLYSISLVLLLIISGMTALISLPDDFLPFDLAKDATASFAGGDGTISNPYQISNVTQLQNIDANLTANYMLVNDIDASDTKNWNSGKGFDPIGNYNLKFIGFFNGNGYNILNLYIHRKSDHHLGLFAHISHQGIVANLSLIDIDFSGQSSVGGIGSRLTDNSVIDNCHVTGEIRVSGGNLGGIVGYSRGHLINSTSNCMIYATGSQVGGLIGEARRLSIIFNCTSNGLVSSGGGNCGGLVGLNTGSIYSSTTTSKVSSHWFRVGGLVGYHSKDDEVTVGGIIQDCHSESEVYSGTAEAGGLVGTNLAVIENCSSNGIVNGKNIVGGFVGNNYGDISNSYSEGKVTGIHKVGGFIGNAFKSSNLVNDSYANVVVRGNEHIGGFIGSSEDSSISRCYSIGSVIGNLSVGGFIGSTVGDFISRCYSIGLVNGNHSVGGFIGNNTDSTLTNCIYGKMVSSIISPVGYGSDTGLIELNSTEMKRKEYFLDNNFDFERIWDIFEDETTPYFQWEIDGALSIIKSDQFHIQEDEDFSYLFGYNITNTKRSIDIRWQFQTNASWLNLNQKEGSINGMPINDDIGYYWLKVFIFGNRTMEDQINITIYVHNVNDIPEIIDLDILDVIEDVSFYIDHDAIDIDPTNDVLSWDMETSAPFISLDQSTGNITGIPTNDDVGTWWVNISVSDGNGGMDWRNFTLTVLNVNDGPTLNITELTITLEEDSEGSSFDLNDVFIDIDGDSLSFDHIEPENLSISIEDGIATIIPDDDWCGSEIIQFSASDGSLSVSINVTVEVTAINDAPFNVQIFAESSYIEGGYQIVNSSATDVEIPFGDELTFTWSSNISGEIGTGRSINLSLLVGSHLITLTVTDIDGLSATASKEIEILPDEGANDDPDDVKGNDKGTPILWIIIGSFIVFVIVALIIALLLMKKKKDVEDTQVGSENDVGAIESQPLDDNNQEYHVNLDIPVNEVPINTIASDEVGIPIQGVPEEPLVIDEALAPIQEIPMEQPIPPDEGTPDQVITDLDPVPPVEPPAEEQISDESQQIPVDVTPLEGST